MQIPRKAKMAGLAATALAVAITAYVMLAPEAIESHDYYSITGICPGSSGSESCLYVTKETTRIGTFFRGDEIILEGYVDGDLDGKPDFFERVVYPLFNQDKYDFINIAPTEHGPSFYRLGHYDSFNVVDKNGDLVFVIPPEKGLVFADSSGTERRIMTGEEEDEFGRQFTELVANLPLDDPYKNALIVEEMKN